MKTFRMLAGTLFIASMTVPLLAQSPLADAARREAARRQAARAATIPLYTNQDLDKLPERPAPAVPPLPVRQPTAVTTVGVGGATVEGAAQGAGEGAAGAAASAKGPARNEEYWRTRITTARSSLARAEMFAEALQSRINALSADFVNRDDPAQRQQIGEQRQAALDEMSKVQGEIAGFRAEIAAIEDEARRAGVPAGWLR